MSVAGCPQLFRKRPASYSATQTPSKWCRSGIDGGQRVVPSSPRLQAPQGPNLRLFMKSYHGLEDYHLQLFRQVQKVARARHVLYPGCFRHVTASLVFPDVSYVDFDAAVEPTFSDERVLAWVQEHKLYKQMAQVRFYCHNFQKELPRHAPRSFDMLISMSAGIVSETCGKYLRQGGHFLASDAHFEARLLASQPESYKLVGVYDLARARLRTGPRSLARHFKTTSGNLLTAAQVEESMCKPKARRSFTLQDEAIFYLFRKL